MAHSHETLGESIYRILGQSGEDVAFLGSLTKALSSPDERARLEELSIAMERSPKPIALANLIYQASPLLASYRHQRNDPRWKFGSYSSRRQIVERLWKEAQEALTSNPLSARRYARSALLMASQEAFHFATAMVLSLLNAPDYEQIAAWPANAMVELRARMESEQQALATFSSLMILAAQLFEPLIGNSEAASADAVSLAKLFSVLNEMVVLAEGRRAIQWRVANFAWRISNLARSRNDSAALAELGKKCDAWGRQVQDSYFDRCLEEALSNEAPPPKTVGYRVMTAETFSRVVQRRAE